MVYVSGPLMSYSAYAVCIGCVLSVHLLRGQFEWWQALGQSSGVNSRAARS